MKVYLQLTVKYHITNLVSVLGLAISVHKYCMKYYVVNTQPQLVFRSSDSFCRARDKGVSRVLRTFFKGELDTVCVLTYVVFHDSLIKG